MPYKECEDCNVPLVHIVGSTDSREEWVEDTYGCPECKALHIHRKEFDQSGLVISDTFKRDTSGEILSSPKKEDAVREALGVEKKFEVHTTMPITGTIDMSLVVNAIDKETAKKRACDLYLNTDADTDDEGSDIETDFPEYIIDGDISTWQIDVQD